MSVFGTEGADGIALLVLVEGVVFAPSSSLPHAPRRASATAALNPISDRRRKASLRVICPCSQFSAISVARYRWISFMEAECSQRSRCSHSLQLRTRFAL
jgi:hypothetical protein